MRLLRSGCLVGGFLNALRRMRANSGKPTQLAIRNEKARIWYQRAELKALYEVHKRLKCTCGQYFLESRLGLSQIAVVSPSRSPACLEPWLIRIEFPGMKVDHYRLALALVGRLDRPSGECHRQ